MIHMTSPGYSGTPLAKKIGIKPGHRVRFIHRPEGWTVPGTADDATYVDHDADVTIAFYRVLADVSAGAHGLVTELADDAMLWIAWPRRASGHDSDISENDLRELFLPLGVVDIKVAALGEHWSGLKFVRRRENRSRY